MNKTLISADALDNLERIWKSARNREEVALVRCGVVLPDVEVQKSERVIFCAFPLMAFEIRKLRDELAAIAKTQSPATPTPDEVLVDKRTGHAMINPSDAEKAAAELHSEQIALGYEIPQVAASGFAQPPAAGESEAVEGLRDGTGPSNYYVDSMKSIREAGGKAWDKVADPEKFIRELRGEDESDEIILLINTLRAPAGLGATVTICCQNDDADDIGHQEQVIVAGDWTDWVDHRFYGETLLAALRKAAEVKREREGKKS